MRQFCDAKRRKLVQKCIIPNKGMVIAGVPLVQAHGSILTTSAASMAQSWFRVHAETISLLNFR